jgi:hypothetical protein
MGAGMIQSIVAAVLDIVPPLIPPPFWNKMPLPCAPMITGLSADEIHSASLHAACIGEDTIALGLFCTR